ncbi:hypothetical protein GCM10012279_40580 [Micromonospora yangpuensis]|nr:hypothetical protein GCM10012279_40580 [Micromonospora yangpuensis]
MCPVRVADLGPRAVEHLAQDGGVDGAGRVIGHGYLAGRWCAALNLPKGNKWLIPTAGFA